MQRFEGVDQELARTLQALQSGLQGFAREVATVVSQTDDNLAKAATQLGSLVNSLQATLDEFDPTGDRSRAELANEGRTPAIHLPIPNP